MRKYFKMNNRKYFWNVEKSDMIEIPNRQIKYYESIKNKLTSLHYSGDFSENPVFQFKLYINSLKKEETII